MPSEVKIHPQFCLKLDLVHAPEGDATCTPVEILPASCQATSFSSKLLCLRLPGGFKQSIFLLGREAGMQERRDPKQSTMNVCRVFLSKEGNIPQLRTDLKVDGRRWHTRLYTHYTRFNLGWRFEVVLSHLSATGRTQKDNKSTTAETVSQHAW